MKNKPRVLVQRMGRGGYRWAVVGFHGENMANSKVPEPTKRKAREAGRLVRDTIV